MKHLVIISFLTALVLTIPGSIFAADVNELKPQTICPVMGGEIDKSIYADHEGQRVYFCCNPCQEKFKADPEKYLKTLSKKGEQAEKLATCGKCGQCKGSKDCCKAGAKTCGKCGLHKGSPGCCKPGAKKGACCSKSHK
ncbi:YHS domain-containing protein [bacterium]|nr:YHS domain-containing protein [bacterium]